MEIVVASRNAHKLGELRAVLAPHRLVALPEGIRLPPEAGDSFAENARAKARAAAQATGKASLADDSGIEVRTLGGAPGVQSARYAGEGAGDTENLAKLVEEMEGKRDRCAAYVCVLALHVPGEEEREFEGRCEGRLAESPRGSGGFGYDPIFIPGHQLAGGAEKTMAELSPQRKGEISHRGRAARMLAEWLSSR